MQKLTWLLALCIVFGGCSKADEGNGGRTAPPPEDEAISHLLEIVIGEEIRSVEQGRLTVYLFAYDPGIADKPADELDVQEILFQHSEGTRTVENATLSGTLPAGFEVYVSAVGDERVGDEWRYILWDGETQTGMPERVEMQLVD